MSEFGAEVPDRVKRSTTSKVPSLDLFALKALHYDKAYSSQKTALMAFRSNV